MNQQIISRIAPTPSGFLHAGNVYNFLLTYLFTRAFDGILHLRIDDYDLVRYKSQYTENIFRVLDMLGIDFDGGASSVAEFEANFSSKFRASNYEAALKRLENLGVCYTCECSHSMKNSFINGIYKQICLNKNLKFIPGKTCVRLHVNSDEMIEVGCDGTKFGLANLNQSKSINLAKDMGDFMIYKKDGTAAYNLASLIDDEQLGVNLLVRGEDLLECSAAQKYTANLLGLNFKNSNFIHHSLLKSGDKKLSKTSNAPAVNLKDGAKIHYKFLAKKLGLNEAKCDTLSNLLEAFKENISHIKAL
ncbi:glutamate--tRNA ligase family protein [Campylobacter sp. RM16189]|uniref:glutamate--tRNA ligase family protein n=1 Tax=Campylobacter sp. RM16189 TaxID=1705726 RepID=UPI0014757565|nr:glutamate--tRNA ligase family protein [Campylobacter sp. RM16189]